MASLLLSTLYHYSFTSLWGPKGQTNSGKLLSGMHSVDIAKYPFSKGMWAIAFKFAKMTSSMLACLQAGFQEHVALHAKGDQNEVGELQKLDRSSCVSPLWSVALQGWKTAQTNQGRFLPTLGHIVNKSRRPFRTGQANSSRFLAGMYSVGIAEYSMPRGMSNKMQQRS